MKKYFVSITLGLVIGFLLSKTVLEEYNGYNGIKTVSKEGITAYFIKYGDYNSLEDLEKNTISLPNYIYLERDNKYSAYIAITSNEFIRDKLIDYFKGINYKVSYEEFTITNSNYIKYLQTADKLLENTSELTVIEEVCSQILSKYEELVINDS